MNITRDEFEFKTYIARGKWEMMKATCLLLFEIREILLKQQENKGHNQ
jgi:hypothetical protein